MKRCRKCGEEKDVDKFDRNKRTSDGRHSYCKSCKSVYEHNRAGLRRMQYQTRRYGITEEEYTSLLEAQENQCAICCVDFSTIDIKKVHVDHCHTSSTVRGILCAWCNVALGMFRDDPEVLTNATRYLTRGEVV